MVVSTKLGTFGPPNFTLKRAILPAECFGGNTRKVMDRNRAVVFNCWDASVTFIGGDG